MCRSELHEMLNMTVAIPLLYGIPPEYDNLRCEEFRDCTEGAKLDYFPQGGSGHDGH